MFSSKLFLILTAITFILMGAAVGFKMAEANSYNLFETIQKQLMGGGSDNAATTADTTSQK